MRTITDHIVEGDDSKNQLTIEVLDEPGAGGANHRYELTGFNYDTNPSAEDFHNSGIERAEIIFQNGPIKEHGVNGITQEALLAIVIDRLRSFQDGPFACHANAMALVGIEGALDQLQERTRDRIARGVEGKTLA